MIHRSTTKMHPLLISNHRSDKGDLALEVRVQAGSPHRWPSEEQSNVECAHHSHSVSFHRGGMLFKTKSVDLPSPSLSFILFLTDMQ